jgi:CDP-diacylglycerol--serine O-phosphatidyltransferase
MFFAKINKSCLITYIGVLFGVLAMYFAFTKMAFSDVDYVRYSLACLVVSGVCDMFDGKFARACKRTKEEKEFGIQLDSLADTFCFLAVPVVFMMSLEMIHWWDVIVFTIFILCGVSRLGYFNIKADADTACKTYQGLPVTSTAIIFPILGLLHTLMGVTAFRIMYLVTTVIVSFLMVVNIRVPKFTGIWYKIIPLLAIALILLLVIL